MNTIVANALGSFLFRRVPASPLTASPRGMPSQPAAAANPWSAETRPVVFRSEAFAEDLEDEWLVCG